LDQTRCMASQNGGRVQFKRNWDPSPLLPLRSLEV
jgi:hypothetical protein